MSTTAQRVARRFRAATLDLKTLDISSANLEDVLNDLIAGIDDIEEVEKKLAAVVVKKAELDAIKKAEEEAKQKAEDDKIALLIAESITMEKEEAAKKRKAEEETECNGRTLSCRA